MFHQHHPPSHTLSLTVISCRIAKSLINPHHAEIRPTLSDRAFHPHHAIVGVRIRPGRSRIYIHHSQFKSTQLTSDASSTVNRNLLTGDRIDPDLPAEK